MATSYDITIKQGSDYLLTVQVDRSPGVPWDLDTPGTTIAASIRVAFDSPAAIGTFTATITDGPAGIFTLALANAATAALVGPGGTTRADRFGVYDVEFTESALKSRPLEGRVSLSQEATK